MEYEYLFMDRKRIGGNIEAIMKDRKCTKVTLSKAMNISRPTLDAFLRGDINNAGKYDEYIKRLLAYMQLTDSVLDNYKNLPDIKKMRCNTVQKEEVRKGLQGMEIPYIYRKTYRSALNECKKIIQKGGDGFALSYMVPDAIKILGELTEDYPDLFIGVTDICSKEEARISVDCGARFVFTNFPIMEVGSFCKDRDVFCAMGATTVAEAYNALDFGSDIINLYPFHAISDVMIQGIRASLPKIEMMATLTEKESDELKEDYFATLVRD